MRRFFSRFRLLQTLLPIIWICGGATSLYSESPDPLSVPEGLSTLRLGNGLEVLLIENPSLPMVGLNLLVKTGSAQEKLANNGASHMLEHLLFNGTEKRTQKQLYDDVDRIGGYNNANTGETYTNFMLVAPFEHLEKAMEIQSDMVFHSTIPENKFAKEKGIVLEEIGKSLANSQEEIRRNLRSILYQGTAFSLPTLGTSATVKALKRDEIQSYYKKHYIPNNMLLSVIGNFNTRQCLKLIRKFYGQARPGHDEKSAKSILKPVLDSIAENRSDIMHRSYQGKQRIINLTYKLPPFSVQESRALLAQILDQKKSVLREALENAGFENGKLLNLELWTSPLQSFITVRIPSGKQDVQLLKVLKKELRNLDFSLPEAEISTLIQDRLTSFFQNLEKPHMFGILNAPLLSNRGIPAFLRSFDSKIWQKAALNLQSLKLSMQPNLVVHQPLFSKSKGSGPSSLKPDLDSRGGAELIVRRNSSSPLLAMHLLFRNKARLEARFGKNAARIFHDCFGQRLESPSEKEALKGIGLSFKVNDNPYFPMDNIYLDPSFGYIRFESLANNWQNVLQTLTQKLKEFKPSKAEFERALKNLAATSHMTKKSGASKVFRETLRPLIYKTPDLPEAPENISYEDLIEFGETYFQLSNSIIAVVSPGTSDEVKKIVWPHVPKSATKTKNKPFRKTIGLQKDSIVLEKSAKGSRSYLYYGFSKEINPKDESALKALSLILSERIVFKVREELGMAYGIRAGIDASEGRALFSIQMGTRPENVTELLPQFKNFFSSEFLSDLDETDVQKAINKYLGRMMFRRLSSINQAYYLSHSLYFHGDPAHDQQGLQKLSKITLSDVRNAVDKYLNVENPVSVTVHGE